MDTREIVGLAVGVVTALSIFVVGVWFVYRRRQRSKNGFHLGGTNLERHSSGLEGGIAPRTPCADATPSCELSSELSDSRNPNGRRDDCTGDPKARQNHKLPCTDVDPRSGLSSDLSYSQNPNGQGDDYTRDPEYSLPRIYIAVFVLEPAQDYASSLLADKEEILSPDGSYVCSLFVNCKFTGLDAHYQFRDLYTSPSEPDEIRAFYATTQRHRDTPIDGIIYDPGIDAETFKMINSVAVPKLPIPNQPPDNQKLTSGIIPLMIAMILEERQKAREQNIRDYQLDRSKNRRSSTIFNIEAVLGFV